MSAVAMPTPTSATKIPSVSMLTVTVQGLRRSRSRFVLTAIAVVMSVAFFTSVLQLTSGLQGTATQDIASATKDIDAVVRGAKIGKPRNAGPASIDVRAELTAADASMVADTNGVSSSAAIVSVTANVIGSKDEIIESGGFGTRAESWVNDSALNTHHLVDGKKPVGIDQVVIDRNIAEKGDFAVGDTIKVVTEASTIQATISGIADFGSAKGSPLNGHVFFTEDQAPSVLDSNSYDRIVVRTDTPDSVVANLQGELKNSKNTEVVSGSAYTLDQQDQATARTSFQSTFLTFFALVALLAGTTIIYNTFVISVQQRIKEIAMLRAIGTSRRQILRSVLGEAALVGVIASAIGVGVGLLLFRGMVAVFEAIGLSFLSTDASISPSSLVGPFVIGVIVTVVSAVLPARRASSVAPIEALRDQAVDNSAIARARSIATYAVLGLCAVSGVAALVTGSGSLGALATGLGFVGTIVGGPLLVRASTATIGKLLSSFGGQTGKLAQTNLSRNPKRNASTSFSLSLGMALIVLFTTVASSLTGGIASDVNAGLRASHVVTTAGTGPGAQGAVPRSTIEELKSTKGVTATATLSSATVIVDGEGTAVATSELTELSRLYDLKLTGKALAELGPTEIAVHDSSKLALGDTVLIKAATGVENTFSVATLFERSLPGTPDSPKYLLSDLQVEGESANAVFLKTDSSPGTLAAVDAVIQKAGALRVLTKSGYVDSLASSADTFRNFVYALLAVALLISLVGIANTTMLSINERRREIGVLRAIGTTSRQVRRVVRLEALLLSIHGSAIGLLLGLAGAASVFALLASDQGLSMTVPWKSLGVIAVLGCLAGVIASAWPAWKASRMDPLQAIASE